VKDGRHHQWKPNEPYKDDFIAWIRNQSQGVHGDPQMWGDPDVETCAGCRRVEGAEELSDMSPDC